MVLEGFALHFQDERLSELRYSPRSQLQSFHLLHLQPKLQFEGVSFRILDRIFHYYLRYKTS